MKYNITKEDLNKRNYGLSFDCIDDDFLLFLEKEKKQNNSFLSESNILKIEREILKSINSNIYVFFFLGLLLMFYGLYIFIKFQPRLAVNLYTQFPYIENGAIPIIFGLSLIIGSVFSFFKRDAILVTKVKSKIIEYLRKEQERKKTEKSMFVSKKRRRFRQRFTGHKKKR